MYVNAGLRRITDTSCQPDPQSGVLQNLLLWLDFERAHQGALFFCGITSELDVLMFTGQSARVTGSA